MLNSPRFKTALLWLVVIVLSVCINLSASKPADHCKSVDDGKIVCICNESNCDMFEFEWPDTQNEAYLVESTRDGLRFAVSLVADLDQEPSGERVEIEVDTQAERQVILGWGGALTDATGLNVKSLPKDLSDKLIESYFGATGNAYNLVRVPIGGSDFSTRAYSYDDSDESAPDLNLTNWALANEDLYVKIPLLKLAKQYVEAGGEVLKPFGSPWSPPKWMKTSKSFVRGHLIDRDEIYESYANYLLKFYEAYRKAGITFWGGTVQNEPLAAYDSGYFFNSLQMSSAEHIKLVSRFLGPALSKNGFTRDKFKLMIGDDNLKTATDVVSDVLANSEARKFVSGIGFHWYGSGHDFGYEWLDKLVDESASSYPDDIEFVLMTEACAGARLWQKPLDLGRWSRAEEYANDIIEDLTRGSSGWVDWNMALDSDANPNWADNHCDTPIVVDKQQRAFYKQPMYYALGHFSRFFRPNSTVVGTQVNSRFVSTGGRVTAVAAHKKDSDHLIVNLLNRNRKPHKISLNVAGEASRRRRRFEFSIKPNSISTVVLKL